MPQYLTKVEGFLGKYLYLPAEGPQWVANYLWSVRSTKLYLFLSYHWETSLHFGGVTKYLYLFGRRVSPVRDLRDSAMPPENLLLVGSDEPEITKIEDPQNHVENPIRSPPRSLLGKRLFFADSDDEDSTTQPPAPPLNGGDPSRDEKDSDSDVEIMFVEDEPETSQVGHNTSPNISPTSSPPPPVEVILPPEKKPRLSPVALSHSAFSSAYLGSFLVGNAWSTVKGKGYVKPGDEIKIERDSPQGSASSKANSSKGGAKAKKPDGKDKGKTKQLSIATLMKPPPPQPKVSKKKVDTVVRLTNSGGFGSFKKFVST
jgi:DNA repair protein RAD5